MVRVCESVLHLAYKVVETWTVPSCFMYSDVRANWGNPFVLLNRSDNEIVNYKDSSLTTQHDRSKHPGEGWRDHDEGTETLKTSEETCWNGQRVSCKNIPTCNGAQRAGRAVGAQLVQENTLGPGNVLVLGWFRVQLNHRLPRDDHLTWRHYKELSYWWFVKNK